MYWNNNLTLMINELQTTTKRKPHRPQCFLFLIELKEKEKVDIGRLLFKLCNRVFRLNCSLETYLIWIWTVCCTATFGPCSFNCITFNGSSRLFLDKTEGDISLLLGVVNVIIGDLWDGHRPLWGHTHSTVSSGLQPPLGASFLMEKTSSRLKHVPDLKVHFHHNIHITYIYCIWLWLKTRQFSLKWNV